MVIKRLSLAQQIAQLEDATPVDFDPEDIQINGIDPVGEPSVEPSAITEHYISVGPSALRKQHDSIADPKYDGVRTTRMQFFQDEDDSSEDDCQEEQHLQYHAHSSEDLGENELRDEDPLSQSEREEEEERSPLSASLSPKQFGKGLDLPENLSSTLQKKRDEDRIKGNGVSRQIAIWDALLDARIRSQKFINATNRLPASLGLSQVTDVPKCRESLNKMFEQAAELSNELFSLQEYLLTSNESITPPPRKKRKMHSGSDEAPNHEIEFREATQAASTLEILFHPYLVQTLSKWSSKIQAVAPSAFLSSNRNEFSSKSPQHLKTAVQVIDETLIDHAKVLARTQVRRGKGSRVGDEAQKGNEENGCENDVDVEIFDDTDFYQQLLRDVIDSRGHGIGGGEDWMVTQKQKKVKKSVDTRASKGRKLRYEIHEKIQNFMVPVPVPGIWHEEQIDELFASLLGKGFENINTEPAGKDHDVEQDHGEALQGGFKVFG